jgi:hypothetical protein
VVPPSPYYPDLILLLKNESPLEGVEVPVSRKKENIRMH